MKFPFNASPEPVMQEDWIVYGYQQFNTWSIRSLSWFGKSIISATWAYISTEIFSCHLKQNIEKKLIYGKVNITPYVSVLFFSCGRHKIRISLQNTIVRFPKNQFVKPLLLFLYNYNSILCTKSYIKFKLSFQKHLSKFANVNNGMRKKQRCEAGL